jgi:hypothetical protein
LLHGSYLALERLLKALIKDAPWAGNFAIKVLTGLTTYLAVLIAWVYFRASDFQTASRLISGMCGRHSGGDVILSTREILQVSIVTFFLLIAHWSLREISLETAVSRLPHWLVTTAWFLMACAIILTQGSSNAFIYFQF